MLLTCSIAMCAHNHFGHVAERENIRIKISHERLQNPPLLGCKFPLHLHPRLNMPDKFKKWESIGICANCSLPLEPKCHAARTASLMQNATASSSPLKNHSGQLQVDIIFRNPALPIGMLHRLPWPILESLAVEIILIGPGADCDRIQLLVVGHVVDLQGYCPSARFHACGACPFRGAIQGGAHLHLLWSRVPDVNGFSPY